VDAKLGYYTYKHHLLDTLSVMTNEEIKDRANIVDVAIENIATWVS
jgi:hydroxyethylthiazole kinase